MTSLQEYDLEIKPTKIEKGHGLCKLVVDAHDPKEERWENEECMAENKDEVYYVPASQDSWYVDLQYFLTHGYAPFYLDPKHRRSLRLKGSHYLLIKAILFR